MHLGHAYSALRAQALADDNGGDLLLRIEDIDQSRARPAWEAQIYDDLRWLGLRWSEPVLRQSERLQVYQASLETLWARGALFACTCSRRDIANALSAPQEGVTPVQGPDGPVYPGTCRSNTSTNSGARWPASAALRLDMTHAVSSAVAGAPLGFTETGAGPNGETGWITFSAPEVIATIGDIVLARREMGTSYHLSVVLDDAAQGITHVVRGRDLFEATKIHVVLQRLLGLPTPVYHHHRLIRDEHGKRLAKRDDARALSLYRAEGKTPADIRAMVGL